MWRSGSARPVHRAAGGPGDREGARRGARHPGLRRVHASISSPPTSKASRPSSWPPTPGGASSTWARYDECGRQVGAGRKRARGGSRSRAAGRRRGAADLPRGAARDPVAPTYPAAATLCRLVAGRSASRRPGRHLSCSPRNRCICGGPTPRARCAETGDAVMTGSSLPVKARSAASRRQPAAPDDAGGPGGRARA